MDSSDSSYYSRQQLDELFLQMIAFFFRRSETDSAFHESA